MIEIYDDYEVSLDGGHFSTYRKNLGNKLFIYAGCRIIADLLNYDLISPENALIRRENNETGTYEDQIFPFKSVLGRQRIDNPTKVISDHDIIALQSIDNLIKNYPNHKFVNQCYFSKYDYIKPYKDMVKSYYESLIQPKRNTNDIVLMLRNSRLDGSFVLPVSKKKIKFKLLTHKDEVDITHEIQALNRLVKGDGNASQEISTRLRYMIQEIDGNTDRAFINNFVKNNLLARDSKSLRDYVKFMSPDMNFKYEFTSDITGETEALDIPFGVGFFYPSE